MTHDQPFKVEAEHRATLAYATLPEAVEKATNRAVTLNRPAVVTHTGILCAVAHPSGRVDYTHHATRVSGHVPEGSTEDLP